MKRQLRIVAGKLYRTSRPVSGWTEKSPLTHGGFSKLVTRWAHMELPENTPLMGLTSDRPARPDFRSGTAEFLTPYGRCWIPLDAVEASD